MGNSGCCDLNFDLEGSVFQEAIYKVEYIIWELEVNHLVDEAFVPHPVKRLFYIEKDSYGRFAIIEVRDDLVGNLQQLVMGVLHSDGDKVVLDVG
ncbi:hypothetical protein TNCV_2048751 [Trichonephila clavipes]|nr:hypothetical protein TNCV_2048751 [Trichonephila clavipes]